MKTGVLIALCVAIASCSSGEDTKPPAKPPCELGRKMNGLAVRGAIYGNIRALIRVPGCGTAPVPFQFYAAGSEQYARLRRRADEANEIIAFQAIASGYMERATPYRFAFHALTLTNIKEVPYTIRMPNGQMSRVANSV